jgi:lipoyl(octanoyl) transferase
VRHERFFCPYADALAWQHALVGRRAADVVPDLLLLVEHEPIVTLGSSAREEHLLMPHDEFRRRGIGMAATDRGGDVTYHGPGQLVAYAIVKLAPPEQDPHIHLRRIEDAGVQALAAFGIHGFRSPGRTGVWTEKGKIAAIGIRVRRWVTFHGIALNVDVDLAAYATIVPCGLSDRRVTSMANALSPRPAPPFEDVASALAASFDAAFGRSFTVLTGADARASARDAVERR